ncbi:MAG TPA: hypothetical protein VK447_01795, partial [Myxococcaceae bacterium]|nr:hypothetical protein [Myxococcaceae bacterium]
MKIERKFSLPESGGIGAPLKLHEGGILEGGHGRPVLRVFPVDNYEFPKEVKDQAKEWHVIKVPLLGQNIGHGEKPDWCGRTSCAMAYNYFQLLQGGNAGERYITHSRAGDPECLLDLRHPGGERAFWLPYDNALPKKGWNTYPAQSYEVQSDYRSYLLANGKPIPLKGEIPLPQQDLFPPPPAVRPLGLGPILRYSAPANLDSYDSVPGHLLPDSMRGQAEEIRNSEKRVRERFAHLVSCLRANNPVVIYTGVGRRHTEKDGTIINPRHIILICGYCILRVGGEDQLWLVTADPSTKRGLVENKQFSVPDPKGLVDLGHPIGASHTLFRMRGGYIAGDRRPDIAAYASFNLVRAKAFFEKNLETVGTDYNLVLDHRDRRGGRYLFREEFTPAPPEVVDSSFSRPRYVFPLRGTTAASSPFERYFNNESLETGVGGYYVLGLQRNLHGGIHLFPPAESRKATPVQAIAPGYVVAARLPGSTAPCRADGVMEALGNWPGFVLVRHELEDLTQPPPPGNQAPPPRAFYTLYMHLSSPAFPGEPEAAAASVPDYFTRVPWFREMYKRRFGAWVNISDTAGGHPLGTMLWSVEPTTASASQAKVLGANGQPQELTVKTAAGQAQWLYKAPPANLTKAVEALEKGKVLTFPEPFFPVAIGDVVGFVAPLPTDPLRDAPRLKIKREQQVDKFEFRSGFLHFQVFAPEADAKSGIKLLAKLANDLELPEEHKSARRTPALPPLTENTEDNFLEVSELEQHLEKSLPQEDQADFHKATHKHFLASQDRKNFGYAKSVIALLDTHTSFAPRAEKPDWKSCTGFEYPLKVEVDVGYLPLPAKNTMIENGSYELELFFEQELDGGTWRRMDCPSQTCGVDLNGRMVCKPASIKLDENKLKGARNGILPLTLMVPATADRLTLKAKQGFTVEQTVPLRGSDGYLFTQGITRRWRNVLLTHKNEWAPDVVRGVLRKVKEELASQSTSVRVTEEQAAQIAWCDAEKEEHVPRVLDNGSDEGDKLFQASGSLPPSGKIENLHPITAVWLLNVLDKQNKARVKSEWPVPDFRKAQPHPLYAGWVKQSGEHRVGGTATAVIIDEDFGYDSKHQIALRMKQGQSVVDLTRGAAASSSGNIVHTVATGFWGDWTLEAVTVPPPGDTSAPKALSPRKRDDRLAADLSVPRPKLVGAQGKEVELREPPRRLPDGSWQWRLDFEKPVPLELSGFMSLRTSKTQDGAAPSYVDAFVPVTARPLQTWTGPEVSRTHFAQENGFIVGLTDEGSNVWRDPKKKLYVVGDLVPYKACFDAMDFPVGWGLVQGLAHLTAKKIAFELLSISETNELSCIVRAANPDKLLEVTTATKKRRREGSKDIELTFGPAVCEDPKQLALWIFDEQRKTVLNCRPAAADVKLG